MTTRPIALDLFCGAGGASMGLHRAGFDVVGVDLRPQPNYPFRFIQADALEFAKVIGPAFSFVWASPPCQRYSAATRQSGNPENHPDLVAPIRHALTAIGIPFVLENVIGAPLIDPVTLCGAYYGLGVVRHRLFEPHGFFLPQPPHTRHRGSLVTGEYVTVAGNGGVPAWTLKERERRGFPRHIPGEMSLERWSSAMGIDWMSRSELVQAIPPAYAEHVGRAAIQQIR